MMRRNRRKNSFRTKYPPRQKSNGGRRTGKNRHHLLNECRKGQSTSENLLWLDITKHNMLHKIFKNDDPEYVILALDRMMTMKGYHRFRGVKVLKEDTNGYRDDSSNVPDLREDDSTPVRTRKTRRIYRQSGSEDLSDLS